MAYLIGIDIGTSGTKVLAIDESGKVAATASAEYPLYTPRPLWAEQRAEDWWDATCSCLKQVLQVIPAEDVEGIGLSGQRTGLRLPSAHDTLEGQKTTRVSKRSFLLLL